MFFVVVVVDGDVAANAGDDAYVSVVDGVAVVVLQH